MVRSARSHPGLAFAASLLGATAWVLAWVVSASLAAPGADSAAGSVFDLAAAGAPRRSVLVTGTVLLALGLAVTGYAAGSLPRAARLIHGIAAVALLVVAAVPLGMGLDPVHLAALGAALVALASWPLATAARGASWPQRPPVARALGAVLLLAVAVLAVAAWRHTPWSGTLQRVLLLAGALWPVVVTAAAWRRSRGWAPNTPARVAIAGIVLVVAAVAGGAAATVLSPATVRTSSYEADVSLRLDPRAVGSIRGQTVLGDVVMNFGGPAPGIDAVPAVRASIATRLPGPGSDWRSLAPSPAELNAAVRSAARELGWRFLLGALSAGVLAAVLLRGLLGAPGRPMRRIGRAVALGAAAATAASLLVGATVGLTYRTEKLRGVNASGVLGLLQHNQDLLTTVEARATQVTPYLRNLLALSAALRDTYAPTSLDDPSALRILLVSDIHAGNQYPLLKTIVEEEHVDAVIDSGDLLNFGRTEELSASRLPQGIASLQVPYLFVRGNHDAAGAGDTRVLDALAKVDNVVLLQPGDAAYTLAHVGGLAIAGFNDPRWFGDSGSGTVPGQHQARDAFVAAFEGRGPLDIVVGHEPAAVRGMPLGSLLVNGHMHVADLEGNRLQAGSFTGGGPLSHYIVGDQGEELSGQPSTFDLLSYGHDCRLQSVTRYVFRDVIEGRPVYDRVSLLNGVAIAKAPAEGEPARACGSGGLTTESVPALPAPGGQTESPTG